MSKGSDKVWAPLLSGVPAEGRVVEVLLARHPQVEANIRGAFVGSGESPLTALGREQVASLAACIAAWAPDTVHASPRERARAVGDEVARATGLRLRIDEDLAEIDFGAAEGLTYEEATKAGVDIDLLGGPPETAPFKDGETWRAFSRRVARAAALIEASGPRVAVVTHGGVVRALLTLWLDMPSASAWRFAVANASIATVTIHEGRGTLRTFGVPAGSCVWDAEAHKRMHL
jgi:broad specificity phosphatase PhoE